MTETVLEESSGAVTAPKKVRLKKPLKITIIVFLEILLFSAGAFGGYFVCKMFMPVPMEFKDYIPYSEIIETYKPSEGDMKKSVSAFGDDHFGIYKRCYYNVLTSRNINVVTKGQTHSAGLVTVDINNVKKLNGDMFYMFISSDGGSGGLSSMTNNAVKAYFNIDFETSTNTWVKVVNLLKNEDDNGKEISELKYVSRWGVLPYAFGAYQINEETIKESNLSTDNGLNKLTLVLDPVESTTSLRRQMWTLAGEKNSYYDKGSVEYIVYFDDDFIIRKVDVNETYEVDYGLRVGCDSSITDTYYYVGDEGYSPISDEENYENINQE